MCGRVCARVGSVGSRNAAMSRIDPSNPEPSSSSSSSSSSISNTTIINNSSASSISDTTVINNSTSTSSSTLSNPTIATKFKQDTNTNTNTTATTSTYPITNIKNSDKVTRHENVGPGSYLPVVHWNYTTNHMQVHCMRWGLCRSYEKQLTSPWAPGHFNARSGSVARSGMFKSLLKQKRCVVPIDGFYEFENLSNGKKQPHYLQNQNNGGVQTNKPLLLAGLYDTWDEKGKTTTEETNNDDQDKDDDDNATLFTSFTLLTMESHSSISWLHHRQPLILSEEMAKEWLSPTSDPEQVLLLIRRAAKDPQLKSYPVTNKMNSNKYQGRDCSLNSKESKGSIMSFFGSASKKKKRKVEQTVVEEDKVVGKDMKEPMLKKKKVKKGLSFFGSASKKKNMKVKMDVKVKESSSLSQSGSWSCGACTFVNKSVTLKCDMCQTKKN